jgi:hypothetical protein
MLIPNSPSGVSRAELLQNTILFQLVTEDWPTQDDEALSRPITKPMINGRDGVPRLRSLAYPRQDERRRFYDCDFQ